MELGLPYLAPVLKRGVSSVLHWDFPLQQVLVKLRRSLRRRLDHAHARNAWRGDVPRFAGLVLNGSCEAICPGCPEARRVDLSSKTEISVWTRGSRDLCQRMAPVR